MQPAPTFRQAFQYVCDGVVSSKAGYTFEVTSHVYMRQYISSFVRN